jgi:hypothetical protein
MAGEVSSLLDLITQGGLVALLLIIIYGGAKRLWVFGWVYEALKQERDEWKAAALSGTLLAAKAVESAETAVEAKKPRVRKPAPTE